MGIEQITSTSTGCPYSCPFCFNGKNDFKEYDLPKIVCNKVILHDDAFLSRKNILKDIEELGSKRVGGNVVYYELKQGVNLKDINQQIADALKKNRFINIRFAWDDSYTKKSYFRILDGIRMLELAGYKRQDMMCFILSNYYVSLTECFYKALMLLHQNITICNCRYRKNYLDPKIYPEHWTMKEINFFKQLCRYISQVVNYNGFDPEITKRIIRSVGIPINKLISPNAPIHEINRP